MLDVQLYGLKPGWHHLKNVLLHIFNALMLFWIFKQMTGAIWKSGVVALLFAIHLLHVESVAWIAERKDLLSTFFALIAMASYLRYVRSPRVGRFIPVLVFFSMGLMTKPMVVTLPFILLLLDFWPLQRLQVESQPKNIGRSFKPINVLSAKRIGIFQKNPKIS